MKKINFHYFEIKGLNQERFFNNLSKKYQIFEINRLEKNRTKFKVNYFDGKKIKKEILDAGFEIVDEKRGGVFFWLAKAMTSYGIIAALILCSFVYVIQLNFVQKVEVWAEEGGKEIESFVWQNLKSRNKNYIDLKKLEKEISANFEDLSFVSAAFVGQSLIINVKSKVLPPEMEDNFAPIISPFDGIITKINLIQGTLMVEVGDIVQKGQTLVEGRVINSEGESFNLQPRAEVYMDVWHQAESTHYDREIVTYRTGRKFDMVRVLLFGKEFYSNGKENTFSQFEQETTLRKLTKNNFLPFVLEKTTCFETATEVIESTFEEKREQVISSAREKCLQNLRESEIIKEENYIILEGGGFTTVRYVITTNLLVTGEDENLHKQTKIIEDGDF